MEDIEIRNRLMELEMAIDHHAKMLEDLSEMLIKQGKQIDRLQKQNDILKEALSQDVVKPLSEESPPPHY
ncbi:MAG: SlyX family protein [Alphaproteobacteria bacterium]|nr:SlyX family protein [Alphaproteobacteria bacterium]